MQIAELKIFTNKLASQKNFYCDVLGLKLESKDDESFSVFFGFSKLTFIENTTIGNPYYHFAVNIPENKLYEVIDWLKVKNVQLIKYESSDIVDFPNWNAHSVYFYDAQGNIVEFIARHNLLNKSEIPFEPSQMLCISEAGMPVNNVGLFCKLLEEKLGENLWWGNYNTFAAMGDENGLFIVVTTNRSWFPTNRPSNPFPLEVKLAGISKSTVEINFENYKISA